ncbi:MAG: hypothetical protein FWE80_07555, partial [Oscillospiraceae bacterium]|nr:hypothetical protein [Oscillospiraceae bacterium]
DLDTGAPHLGWIRDAAEWHQRIFYIMYDVSGARAHGDEVIYTLQQDIVRNLESRDIINSPAYAHANNRPVICIWGLNGAPQSRYPAETVLLPFIRWLKRRGYFVIGGSCDDNWRSDNSCFTAVYNAVDMLSPWTVGRYNPDTVETFFIKEGRLQAERDWCAARGIFYQPVLFPGFSWCNWNNNAVNHIPRASGRFLWQQARLYAAAGIKNLYFAMYDEYDEGTALMKAATDSRMIPAGPQYFQTLAADGQWLSADYYLRLAGRITALLKQNAPFKKYPDIPYSKGPVYWYNGFERRTAYVRTARKAAAYPVEANIDVCLYNPEWLERKKAHELVAAVVKGGDYAHSGEYGFAFSGFCAADGLLCYKIADTRIKSGKPLHLLYALKPGNEGGLKVRVDLLFDDGSRLSERVAAPTFSGEIGEWQQLSCPIKPTGRTVTAVLVTAEGVGGDFAACIDDIEIVET